MNFLKKLFGKKEDPIRSYEDFWLWFQSNEKKFYEIVKRHGNVEKDFFRKLSPKLNELKDGYFYLTGMYNDDTVELVFTADGAIKNIPFVEDLVNAAPLIEGWRFTSLKPALDIKDVSIEMSGYKFNIEKIQFYSNDKPEYPDEIDITIVHQDYNEDNKTTITNGTFIFLDNYLGEMKFATTIDNIQIVGKQAAENEVIPIEKLLDYLNWREKEFVEKYQGTRRHTENDTYSVLEARLKNGKALIAVINTDLLTWENKASHPWVMNIEIKYDGSKNNGMPDSKTYEILNAIEGEMVEQLKDADGYLNIGRQTADSTREIYFACKDFRKPSRVVHQVHEKYAQQFEMSYEIYKDKYWQSFNRFVSSPVH